MARCSEDEFASSPKQGRMLCLTGTIDMLREAHLRKLAQKFTIASHHEISDDSHQLEAFLPQNLSQLSLQTKCTTSMRAVLAKQK